MFRQRTSDRNRTLLTPLSALALVAILLILVVPVGAQDPDRSVSDDEVNAVAKDLFCPICENTPLDVCETKACADWREVIREKLAEGQSEEQIKDYFGNLYGVRALAEPPAEGITLPVWLVPLILVPAAIVGFALYMRSLRRSPSATPAAGITTQDESGDSADDQDPYIARIESELRDM